MISIGFALSLGSVSGQAGQTLIRSSLTLPYCLLLGSLTSRILSVSPVACPSPLELHCGADVKRRPGLSCRHLTPDLRKCFIRKDCQNLLFSPGMGNTFLRAWGSKYTDHPSVNNTKQPTFAFQGDSHVSQQACVCVFLSLCLEDDWG